MLYSGANPSPLIFGELDYTMSGHFGMGKKCLKVRQALGTCQVSYVSIILLTMQYSQNPTTLSRVNISYITIPPEIDGEGVTPHT